mmetsp:Transcript_14249/g.17263  ORF Transcript_14249/g.17263 Transcript_14249/m.17263 type:complete len:90 (+) Transcript_14249:22-291(+)
MTDSCLKSCFKNPNRDFTPTFKMSVAPSADAGGNIKIKNVISGLGGTPEDAEIISALHRMDKDGDGTISVIDLVHIANTRVKNEKKFKT